MRKLISARIIQAAAGSSQSKPSSSQGASKKIQIDLLQVTGANCTWTWAWGWARPPSRWPISMRQLGALGHGLRQRAEARLRHGPALVADRRGLRVELERQLALRVGRRVVAEERPRAGLHGLGLLLHAPGHVDAVGNAVAVGDDDGGAVVRLGLEEGLQSTVDAAAGKSKPVVSVSAGINPRAPDALQQASDRVQTSATAEAHVGGGGDPHVWFDPANAKTWTDNIEKSLSTLDPARAGTYQANLGSFEPGM
jgi:hypothetical protein